MGVIEAIWNICIYIGIMLMFVILARRRYEARTEGILCSTHCMIQRIYYPLPTIIALSLISGWYSGWRFPFTSDRENYAIRFILGNYIDGTYGLRWLSLCLKIVTDDPKILFFIIGFICTFITLVAINKFECQTKMSIILLVSSALIPSSYYLLKQAPAVAFAMLALATFIKREILPCILLTIVAILFHESAIILIPLYIVMLGAKKRWLRILEYALLVTFLIYFRQIVSPLLKLASLIDYIDSQTSSFNELSIIPQTNSSALTVMKGLPIYIINIYAISNRNIFKMRIKNYDQYLIICCVGSLGILLSAYMYWMFRFSMYCYLPIFIFGSLLQQEIKSTIGRMFFAISTCGPLIFITLRFLFQIYY